MEIGYQRQLTYMRDDHSFSAFGKADSSGSTWYVTATLLREPLGYQQLILPQLQNILYYPSYHLLLDSAPNIGPLISRWELDKFKNC